MSFKGKNDADLYRWAIEALELAIIADEFGIVRHVGKDYASILEMPPSEIIGKPIQEIVPNTRMPHVIRSGEPDLENVFSLKNDTSVIVNRYPIRDEDGNIRGAIGLTSIESFSRLEVLNNKIANLTKENALYKRKLDELNNALVSNNVVGKSKAVMRVKELVQKAADSDATVLFTGETGTGKEVFANYLQQLSYRKLENFVKINCAAIPKDLLESELFGYSEGAFSGAKKDGKKGKFELADNGTILLDEISELSFELQAKLLRVLQEKEIESIGSLKSKKINVRVICCTNQALEELVRKKMFREDLYYRINVIEIQIPPLRERLDDISLLCGYFIKKINKNNGIFVEGIADKVIELFCQYDWPGNVRELEHVLERACIMSPTGVLDEKEFDFFEPRLQRNRRSTQISPAPLSEKKSGLKKGGGKAPDSLLELVSQVVTPEKSEWAGSASELLKRLGEPDIRPNVLTRRLNANAERLWNEYGIRIEVHRSHAGRTVKLTRVSPRRRDANDDRDDI